MEASAPSWPTPDDRPPIGALGTELSNLLGRPVVVALGVATVVGLAGPLIVLNSLPSAGLSAAETLVWLWLAAAVCVGSLVAACLVAAVLPPFLLNRRDRTASVVHAWIGAREVRRILGTTKATLSIPTSQQEAVAWLASQPDTDRLLPLRIDVLVMVGRFAEARAAIDRLPRRTPLEEYRAAEARALVDDQAGGEYDTNELRQALSRVPAGIDRAEAGASLAVFEARRAVARGDWREPLVRARPDIPGSDAGILLRDFCLPIFRIIVRWVGLPVFGLIVGIATLVTVMQIA